MKTIIYLTIIYYLRKQLLMKYVNIKENKFF